MENAATRMVRGQDPIRHHVRRQIRQSLMAKPAPHTRFLTVPWPRPRNCAAFIRLRRSPGDIGFCARAAVHKPRSLSGIVEADGTFVLESFKGRWSDLPRAARKRGGKARHPGPYQDNIPVLVARDRKGATFDAVLPQVDGASIGAALAGIVTPGNHLIGDGGRPIAAFARRAGIPFHAVPSPGKPAPEAPHLHINNVNAYHSRLKQWLSRFNGLATKNLPNYLGWRRALEAWGDQLAPPNWIKGAIGNGPYQQLTL